MTRLRTCLARWLLRLARRVGPSRRAGHTDHVHVTIQGDASGMIDAFQRFHDTLSRRNATRGVRSNPTPATKHPGVGNRPEGVSDHPGRFAKGQRLDD